jgi:hypothetical protein
LSGISMPSAFAGLRLITSSYLAGRSIEQHTQRDAAAARSSAAGPVASEHNRKEC